MVQQTHKIIKLSFVQGTLEAEVISQYLHEFLATLQDIFKYDSRISEGVWRSHALYYREICQRAKQAGFILEDHVPRWQKVDWDASRIPSLRQEQKEAIQAWMQKKQGVIVMPTGTGKTEVALAIMHELKVSTLIVTPVRDLMYQWHNRILNSLVYDAGIIGDNAFNDLPVSVTTYESAYIHMDKLGAQYQLLIFDECHHLPGKVRREAALMSAAPLRLGLTATPERSDGCHADLEQLIGPIVYNLPIQNVRGSTLADYDIVRIPVHLSPEEQTGYNKACQSIREYMIKKKKTDPSFDWLNMMSEVGQDPEARSIQKAYYFKQSIQDRATEKFHALEDIFRLHIGEPVLVFTGTNVMARDISCRFLVPCLLNHCNKRERMEILDGFRTGIYPVLVANQVLDEGVDIPEAKVAVVLGGGSSSRQAKQRLGRILRKHGNKRGILYEVVCEDTGEVQRSQQRRKNDAYKRARHQQL